MTEEVRGPTIVTWKQFAVLDPTIQTKIIEELMQKALYGGLDPKLAGRYSRLADVLTTDNIRMFAREPELLLILASYMDIGHRLGAEDIE